MNKLILLASIGLFCQCNTLQKSAGTTDATVTKTFTNPLLPAGADPWVIQKNGVYYYMHTTGNRLVLGKTMNIAELKNAELKTIWEPPAGTAYSKNIWAPEIHLINGKWYIYFAADDGNNRNHRLYVLENDSADPLAGTWLFKGKVSDATDKWAIDGSVFIIRNELYMVWSGWEGNENGRQDIFIAKMSDPWTISGSRVRLSSPKLQWEKHGDLKSESNPSHVDVNEGPEMLQHKDRIFLVYSASGCWTDFYALGMLSIPETGNLMDSASWIKNPDPVFKQTPANKVYAPGHNSFFKSPDGKEDWILYHANSQPGQGCGRFRSPRAQRFIWNKLGMPVFGDPVPEGLSMAIPSANK
ncbi:MAG: glycoside hydrolase family 43 protein [Chitinophagaceae bacterium]